jgi:hypothetical protein
MSPVDLRARVEEEIRDFIDWDAWELSRKAEAAEVETIDDILAKWRDAISNQGLEIDERP